MWTVSQKTEGSRVVGALQWHNKDDMHNFSAMDSESSLPVPISIFRSTTSHISLLGAIICVKIFWELKNKHYLI